MSDVIVTDTNGIIGTGEGYEFTIPPGKYTREQLQEIVQSEQRRAMESRRVTSLTVVKPNASVCQLGCAHYGHE